MGGSSRSGPASAARGEASDRLISVPLYCYSQRALRPDKAFVTPAGQVQALLQERQAEAQNIEHEPFRELGGERKERALCDVAAGSRVVACGAGQARPSDV